jgi:hypothetical protein
MKEKTMEGFKMKVSIEIDGDGEAMEDPREVVDVIRRKLEVIQKYMSNVEYANGYFLDRNGNDVGTWSFEK